MTFRLRSIALALSATLLIPVPAHARKHDTTVELVNFDGWTNAYSISNGIVDVVVVPSIGRIMSYHFTGHPETSPIWVNPDEMGKPAGDSWVNFGGDKVWPAPQGEWGKHTGQGRNWPPDPAIDPGSFTISRIDDGVRLTGTPSKAFAISINREIVLKPGQSQVSVTDSFVRSADAAGGADALPLGIWNVTQTKGDEMADLPFDPKSTAVVGGFVAIEEGTPNPTFRGTNWTIGEHDLFVNANGLKRGNKVGVDDTAGVVTEKNSHNIVFSEKFDYVPGGPYLDNGTDAQVYANDNPAYIEIEAHSTGKSLKPGESMSRTIIWDLHRSG